MASRKKIPFGVLTTALITFVVGGTYADAIGNATLLAEGGDLLISELPVRQADQAGMSATGWNPLAESGADTNDNIRYLNEEGKIVFAGDTVDVNGSRRLADIARQSHNRLAIAEFGLPNMITYPAIGKEVTTIVIFSDINCGYCQKLHGEVPLLLRIPAKMNTDSGRT